MPASKIVDEQEVIRWFAEGKTYEWMSGEYMRKYHIETSPTMWSNFRRRRGLDGRVTRNSELIPWKMTDEHRWRYPVQMLRAEARRRAGLELRPDEQARLESWLSWVQQEGLVVHYDPELEEGFVYVPREDADVDLVRDPKRM